MMIYTMTLLFFWSYLQFMDQLLSNTVSWIKIFQQMPEGIVDLILKMVCHIINLLWTILIIDAASKILE